MRYRVYSHFDFSVILNTVGYVKLKIYSYEEINKETNW